MAATVSSSVWGSKSKPGAWAIEVEQHEDELHLDLQSATTAALPLHTEPPSTDFPTLATAAATKTKKKKGQTLSLAEFSNYSSSALKPTAADSQRLTADELLVLPTGPRQRSAEELERSRSGFGGGFRNYGYDSANPRARDSERGAGYNGNSARDRIDEGLSRADEVDDWSKTKKYVGVNGDRREKVEFFNSSRADEVDNWSSNKNFTSTEGRRERRLGFDSFPNGSDSDNWARKKEERDSTSGRRFERERRGVGFESSGAADSENWLKKKENNGGVADGGRPRLNLQPRTLPISNSNGGGQEVKPKGLNPFGDARPREEVLKEKGKDWKEIDEKLEAVKVKEETGSGAGIRRKGFGMGRTDTFKDDLKEKRSWRKGDMENAAQPASADKVKEGEAEKAEDNAAEKKENGEVEKN